MKTLTSIYGFYGSLHKLYSLVAIVLVLFLGLSSCGIYSFTGASISPNTKTMKIDYFKNKAPTVQASLSQVFSNKIQDYFISQSNLILIDNGVADVSITGEIVGYNFSPIAIQSNDQAAKTRLTITVRVRFVNRLEPKFSFDQNFSRYEDYDAKRNPSEVEDQLIESISTQLIEDIYQRAFVNW